MAMKGKMKLDLRSMKDFVVEHGEKLAFGVVAIVFAMFVYSALKREVLEAGKQPDQLRQMATQVQTHVEQSTFDAKREGLAVVDYVRRAKRDPVAADLFKLAVPVINPPIAEQKTKRDDPQVFPPEDLRVDAGFDVFALQSDKAKEAAGSQAAPRRNEDGPVRQRVVAGRAAAAEAFKPRPESTLEPKAWAVVTGLVPWRKQTQEYSRVFDDAQGFNRELDVPQYMGARIERAQIDPSQPEKLEWSKVDASVDFEAKWESAVISDVIREDYVEPALTARLGPIVTGTWDGSVSHPRIPLAAAGDEARAAPPPEVPQAAKASAPAQKADNPFRAARPPAAVPTGPAAQNEAKAAASPAPAGVEYRLLRIFDYTVQPKMRYAYRIKLGLANPNYNRPPISLKNPESRTREFLETEWSAPTDVVAIPDQYGVLSGGLAKESRSQDPTATLMITAIDPEAGVEAATQLDLQRAGVADTKVSKVNAVDPRSEIFQELADFEFRTGIVVLDIRGGRPLSRKINSTLTAPVEVLVLDAQGNLRVRSEMDDQAAVATRKPPEDSGKTDKDRDPIPDESDKAGKSTKAEKAKKASEPPYKVDPRSNPKLQKKRPREAASR
jgi:hypothetical protein